MKIYKVLATCYGDEHVKGYYSTEEKANRAMSEFRKEMQQEMDGYCFDIEPIEVE